MIRIGNNAFSSTQIKMFVIYILYPLFLFFYFFLQTENRIWDFKLTIILIATLPVLSAILFLTDKPFRTTKIGSLVDMAIGSDIRKYFVNQFREDEIEAELHYSKIHHIQHERNMKEVEYLERMVKINFQNAKTDIEKARALILKDAINYIGRMSDRWKAYIYACVNGVGGTEPEDKDLQAETEKIKKDIEYEKWRKENIDNNDRQSKANENKPI